MNPTLTLVSTLLASAALAQRLEAYPIDKAFHDAIESPVVQAQEPSARRFDIPEGPLGEAIDAFQRATGLIVTVSEPAIRTIVSPGVRGLMTPAQALDRLLAGTGVAARAVSPSVFALQLRAMSESVDVTAPTPSLASPKFTEPLRDTPQTITVIPQSVYQSQDATSLRDVLRNTPGVTLTAGEGGTAPGDNLLIRGFSARNDVYIDGARDAGVTSRDTFNTEAVEVAKGPSSVTAGRGATGGSVNLVTKGAELSNFANVRATAGNADYKRTTLDVNRRLGDGIALRVNGMWQDAGVPRRDAVKNTAFGLAPTIGIGLNRATSFTLGYQHLHQNNIPDYGLPGSLPAAATDAGLTVKDLDFSNFYGLVSRDRETLDADVVTATVKHHFTPVASLRNLTRYGRNRLDRVVTPPRAASPANSSADPGFDASVSQIRRTDTKYQFRTDRTISNQTDLVSSFRTGRVRHDAVVGLELSHESQPAYSATDTYANGRPPVTDLFHPNPNQAYTPDIVRTGATTEGRSNTAAVYGMDTIKLTDRWQANVSGRYDRSHVTYDTVATSGAAASYSREDGAFSGRTALAFKPAPRGTIYGAFSTSFNPSFDGNFGLTLSATGGNSEALPPERSRNIEAGTKWDVGAGLSLTAAAFRMEKTDAKTTDTSGATVLAGDQEVNGVEFGVAGNVTRRWSVFGGLSFMDSRIKASGNSAEVDKELSYVPKTTFNIWSTYRLGPAITVGGGAQYTAGYYFRNDNALSSANAEAIKDLTEYWLVSAMASYRFNSRLALQVNGTNLANTRYAERGYSGHFIPGPGRALHVGAVIGF
jgi:catecholate siderophore receptor